MSDLGDIIHDFESSEWCASKALSLLYKNRSDKSSIPAICNAMRRLADADVLNSLMQFCHMIVIFDMPELEELLMERCHGSMHFSLRMFFLLQAAMEDEVKELEFKTNGLWKQCELAAINAESNSPPRNRVCVENGSFKKTNKASGGISSPSPRVNRLARSIELPAFELFHDTKPAELSASTSLLPRAPLSPSAYRIDGATNVQHDPLFQFEVKAQSTNQSTGDKDIDNKDIDNKDIDINKNTYHLVAHETPTISSNTTLLSTEPPPLQVELNGQHESPLSTTSSSPQPPSPTEKSSASSPFSTSSSSSSPAALSPPQKNAPLKYNQEMSASILQPSYASAIPSTAPARPTEHNEPPDRALGSAFYFKLRQLSGEAGKQRVYEYFYTELHMINSLFNISTALISISLDGAQKLKEVRCRALQLLLDQINTQLIQCDANPSSPSPRSSAGFSGLEFGGEALTYGIEIPIVPGWVIVKIHPEDSFCLNSRNRVPYMMLIEVLAFESDEQLIISNQPQHQTRYRSVGRQDGDEVEADGDADDDWVVLGNDDIKDKDSNVLKQGFIELWIEKEKRIKDKSPFSHLPGWRLAGVIVKSGDDLRQEQLASQLIFKIHSWFQAEKLPLYLRPYVVLATSSTTGLIECISDTCSIDSLKKRIPNFGNLLNYFIMAYGHRTSHKFVVAQTNFVESLAAYSIVCYLLQIKDRHNGNILLDVEGHVIHIDFGFMLSISPGNLGFELAPFKLNQEMVELMGGANSDMFKYFKTLLLSALLEVRRHAEELLLLVEVMSGHSRMACFAKGGAQVLSGLRERLAIDKTEEEMYMLVDTLVYNAMRSWTTQSYDSYQYYTNGIL